MNEAPVCFCGAAMTLRITEKHHYRSGKPRKFWACTDPNCDGLVGAHPNGKPLGTPESKRVRLMRQDLHRLLGKYWNYDDPAERREMYSFLRKVSPKSHIGQMNESEILAVMKLLEGGESHESTKNVSD